MRAQAPLDPGVVLKKLEANQMVHREEHLRSSSKVEYSLIPRGKSCIPSLDQMCD